MIIQVTGKGSDRNVIADGRHIDEECAYGYAKQNQGYEGSYAEWLDLPAAEREAYELGAAGISKAMTTATAVNTFGLLNVVRHLTPYTLAAISVELHAAEERNTAETGFLACVDDALNCNVGEEEAEELRQWFRENI